MTDEEYGVWRVIQVGRKTNHPIPDREVLELAIATGLSTGVDAKRSIEIFEAVLAGKKPGAPPL